MVRCGAVRYKCGAVEMRTAADPKKKKRHAMRGVNMLAEKIEKIGLGKSPGRVKEGCRGRGVFAGICHVTGIIIHQAMLCMYIARELEGSI